MLRDLPRPIWSDRIPPRNTAGGEYCLEFTILLQYLGIEVK